MYRLEFLSRKLQRLFDGCIQPELVFSLPKKVQVDTCRCMYMYEYIHVGAQVIRSNVTCIIRSIYVYDIERIYMFVRVCAALYVKMHVI
jgi:hypothetical protein